jgi:hypothetical protein
MYTLKDVALKTGEENRLITIYNQENTSIALTPIK